MKKAAVIFGFIFSLATVGFGQRQTVTNFTLEKYQQQRLAAEKDSRETYARMGFPSPEELDRQRDADMTARIQLAEQLRQARLENERIEMERRNAELNAAAIANASSDGGYDGYSGDGYYGGYIGGVGGYYNGNRWQSRSNRFFNGGGYRATPVGVYPTCRPRMSRVVVGNGGGATVRTGRH